MTAPVRALFTDQRQGNLAVSTPPEVLDPRRRAITIIPWTWVRQVHGADVVVVEAPGHHAGATADAVVTTVAGAAIAVHTADCAPLLLEGRGIVAVVHAGWRGLEAGVVEATAATMSALGRPAERATLGPTIRGRCYEFGIDDRAGLEARYGPSVRATTAAGAPGLEVAAGIAVACDRLGIAFTDQGTCTACSPVHWSYRARGDAGRQALVAWLEP